MRVRMNSKYWVIFFSCHFMTNVTNYSTTKKQSMLVTHCSFIGICCDIYKSSAVITPGPLLFCIQLGANIRKKNRERREAISIYESNMSRHHRWLLTVVEHLCGILKESRESCFQHSNEITQFFCHTHKQVVEQNILLGLFQSPTAAWHPEDDDGFL